MLRPAVFPRLINLKTFHFDLFISTVVCSLCLKPLDCRSCVFSVPVTQPHCFGVVSCVRTTKCFRTPTVIVTHGR